MSTKTSRWRFVVIFIALVIGLCVAGISALSGSTAKPQSGSAVGALQTSHPAFTLATSRTLNIDGRERLLSTQQRFQRSDGTYKLVQTFYASNGTTTGIQTYFGFMGLGVFRLDQSPGRLVFTGPQIDDRPADVQQFLRNHPLFTREESVAGVSTVVWRQADQAVGEFTEEYRAASLGGILIKSVKVTARGQEKVEATSIQMGEPAESLFNELLSYPSDYSTYERTVRETEADEPEVGALMRQLLERMRQVRSGSTAVQ